MRTITVSEDNLIAAVRSFLIATRAVKENEDIELPLRKRLGVVKVKVIEKENN